MTQATRTLTVEAASEPCIAATAVGSGNPDDLALVRRAPIALAQWWRVPPVAIPAADLDGVAAIRLEGDAEDAAASVAAELALSGARSWHVALADDVGRLACRFAAIAGCDEIALRLEVVRTDACHRFHADYVSLRLLSTYVGPGTEWIVAAEAVPTVRQVATGHVAVLKGRQHGPVGILHRSPPMAGSGGCRLVLAIDPLRTD